jgi:hypothetical protein
MAEITPPPNIVAEITTTPHPAGFVAEIISGIMPPQVSCPILIPCPPSGIVAEITQLTTETERTLALLGPAVPSDDSGKGSLVQTLVAGFCRDFVGALVEKRADVKTGRRIKDAFVRLQVCVLGAGTMLRGCKS